MVDDDQQRGEVSRWIKEIQLYEKEFRPWEDRVKKIVKRYKDERKTGDLARGKFNVLWANLQTLLPAIYSQNPVPNVDRRNTQTEDEIASKASEVIERALSYYVSEDDFFDIMEQCALDRLLGGRATAAVRYVPEFGDELEITNDPNAEGIPELKSEKLEIDYTNWLDFGHTWGRTWDEVRATWKKAYLTKEEGLQRFGEMFEDVPLDYSPEKLNNEKIPEDQKKACIYEIWDKTDKRVIWISKSHPIPLDEKPDPLQLNNFFPWPKPLYATLANDSLIPTPDYTEYQDQAQELDELTARVKYITKAIKVAGVYDSSAAGIERLLVEGEENVLIPVANWAVFGDKGGLKGSINFLPVQEIAQTLLNLYEARDKVKADLNEITGLSDIIRGQSDPNETAAAQNIKSNFGTLRLDRVQKQMQRFVRDTLRIMGQIIATQFSMQTLQDISGIDLPMAQDKLVFQHQQMMAQQPPMPPQPGQPPIQPPPPPDYKTIEFMNLPTWEDVFGFLQNDKLRSFRIDIETDSTIKQDQQAEQAARLEFIKSAGGFLQQMNEIQNPDMMLLAGEMLKFGIGGFKVAKDLQNCFDMTIDKMEKEAQNPQPKPNPEVMKVQAQAQLQQQQIQADSQAKQQEAQNDMQIEITKQKAQAQQNDLQNQLESQREQQKQQMDAHLQQMQAGFDAQIKQVQLASDERRAQMDNETKIIVAQIQAKTSLQAAGMKTGDNVDESGNISNPLDDLVKTVADSLNQVFASHAELTGQVAQLAQQVTAPKKIIRGPDGKMTHVVIDNGAVH